MVAETVFLVGSINKDYFLFKVLINYLFVLALLPLIYEKITRGRIDIFSPIAIFSFFYLLLFGVRSLDLLIFRPEILDADEKYYIYALIYAIIGLHFFQLGYFSKIGQLIFIRKKLIADNWSGAKFKIVLFIYSAISLMSFLIMIKLSGGFVAYFGNISHATVGIISGKALLFMSVLLVKIPLLIWFCQALKSNKFSLSLSIFICLVLLLFFSLGERGHLIFLIISLLICYHYLKNQLRTFTLVATIILVFSFLIIFSQYREFSKQNVKMKWNSFQIKLGAMTFYDQIVTEFDQLIRVKDIIRNVPEPLNYQYGKTFLNLIFKPIPSRNWESKPQGAGFVVTKTIYPKHFAANASIAVSLIGELYLNFQIIGIISGMFLFGVFNRTLYNFFKTNITNRNAVIIYAFFVPYIFSELRGDFAVVSSFLIFELFFLIVGLSFIKKNTIVKFV